MGKRKADVDTKEKTPGQKKLEYFQKRKKGEDTKPEILSRQDRKQARKERKASKPHAELVAKANEVWKPSTKQLSKQEISDKIGEILETLEGKLELVSAKHDCSRAIQYIIKNGTYDQKQQVFNEVKDNVSKLVIDTHGHYLVLALLKHGKPQMKSELLDRLCDQNLTKLAMHASAAQIVDYIYATSKANEQDKMLMQFYGPAVTLFQGDNKSMSLESIIAADEDKTEGIMASLSKFIAKAVTKDKLHFRHIHGLCARFLKQLDSEKRSEFIETLSKHALKFHHSAEGAWLVCEILAYGSPKVRKTVLKGLKGRVMDLATNEYAHLILIRAFDVVDDTVLLNSVILEEIKEGALDLMQDPHGRRLLLSILAPKSSRYFYKKDLDALYEATIDGKPTSRKSALSRKAELCGYALPWLLQSCTENLQLLALHKLGSQILYEVLRTTHDMSHENFAKEEGKGVDAKTFKKLSNLAEASTKALGSIAKLALCGPADTIMDDASKTSGKGHKDKESGHILGLVDNIRGHLILKQLLLQCSPAPTYLADVLYNEIKTKLAAVVQTNRGAFVVTAMLDDKFKDQVFYAELCELLNSHEELASSETAGAKALISKLPNFAAGNPRRKTKKTPKKMATPAKKNAKKQPK